MDIKKEFIICSAVHFDDGIKRNEQPLNIESGIVIGGRRHNNCFFILKELGYLDKVTKENTISGFLTNADRFLNRQEAFVVAKRQGQLLIPNLHEKISDVKIKGLDITTELLPILTSEDLFTYTENEI